MVVQLDHVVLQCFFFFFVYITIISNKSWTLPFGNHKNIARICLSPDGRIIITVDDGKYGDLRNSLAAICILYSLLPTTRTCK